ncbi:MAG: sulfatase [Planctomycetaceae bacterium]|nr:sulfatase [Planctomycetaceae bacterium]
MLILADDLGYLDSTVAGAKDLRTPNLERLARDGMTFTHAFAASPSCAPSRAALLTGLMPARNGAMLNHQPPRADVKKWPAYFHEMGYEVAAFGKVAHYKQGKDYGFDLVAHDTFHDDECIGAALEYLENRDDPRPLCLCVGTNWPHVPWPEDAEGFDPRSLNIPRNHIDTPATREWRARYYAAVERFDADLGKVYEAAYDKLGETTVFVHASDHGAQWPFGKWNLYDDGTRVPFFVVWPGVTKAGNQSDAMVSLVDVLPTLIDLAGGGAPEGIDGRSFADVVRGTSAAPRDAIFTTHSRDGEMNVFPIRSVRTSRWKYVRNLDPHAAHTTHIDKGKSADGSGYWGSWVDLAKSDKTAKAKVDRYHHRPAEEFYDLENDPYETSNLAGDSRHANTLDTLRKQLDDWMTQQGDRGLATERDVAENFYEKKPAKRAGN